MKKLFSAAAAALLALPMAASADIVINEIMYDPISSDNGANAEWIELYNTDSTPVNLTGYKLKAGSFNEFVFPSGATIAGNGFVVVCGLEIDTFVSSYKNGIDPDICYFIDNDNASKLGNGATGATITLSDASSAEVDKVAYKRTAPWPVYPNGIMVNNQGFTLELTDPTADNNDGANWLVSLSSMGTPGRTNSRAGKTWYSAAGRDKENPTATDTITISADVYSSVTVTSVEAYVAEGTNNMTYTPVAMTDGGGGHYSADIGPFSDKTLVKFYVKIVDSDGSEVTYPPLAPLHTERFVVLNNPITANEIAVTEIMINPSGTDNGTNSEYVELYNRTADPIDLSYYVLGRRVTDSYWRLLPEGTIIPGHGYVVVAGRIDLFLNKFGSEMDSAVPLVDLAWRRSLSVFENGGSDVFLATANQFKWTDLWENQTYTPIHSIKFDIGNTSWPTSSAIDGKSLELKAPDLDPTDGANWAVSTASPNFGTPGAANSANVSDWSVY